MNVSSNDSYIPSKLVRCNGSFLTFYWDSPAQGFHFYSNVTYIIINTFLSVAGICLNVLVWLVYWRNRSVRTSSNMLLLVLALSDFLVNAFVQPFSIARMVNEIRGVHSCFVLIAARLSSYCCCGVSLLTVAIICIERFITLAYPYRYRTILPPSRLKIITITTWVAIITFVCLHLGPVSYAVLSSVGNFLILLSIFIVFSTWFWVNRLVRRHKNAIDSRQTPKSENQKRNLKQQTSFRTTRTSYLICGAVLLFYFPSLVLLAYNATQDYDFVVLFLVAPWVETVMFSNSLLNPSLLLWRKSAFRETAREILSGKPLPE